ncbi:MAG: aminotransferase class V-fold PLP-dependent enzyme [Candidatus Eremiobacteraeota bacterium]|nr:aminotransferase class V-fold PLP-dependent enzyme [Candidatus Eremiobacteraeota bacterium]MCW5866486.1 aminotransferase class V-fold PLP-dependent enzyme [Candidatus Eremiobacteraeota bacterium]
MAQLGSRRLFPHLKAASYLNHAGVSPLSTPVVEAVQKSLAALAGEGVGAVPELLSMRFRLRCKLSWMLGCEAEDVALTTGTSWGVLAIAQNFPWRQGDRIACVEGEFPTNVTPWQATGQEVIFLKPDFSDLEMQLKRGIRLLAFSAVSFQTGWLHPWREIAQLAHQYECEVFVDAIQAVGVLPFSVGELDYVAGGAHKWLMGAEGCGYLYVSPRRQAQLHRRWAGWLSHQQAVDFLFEGPGHLRYDRSLREDPQFLEIGSSSALSQAALEASLNLVQFVGVEGIFAHVTRYLDELEAQLSFPGWFSLRQPGRTSGILSLKPPPGTDLAAWEKALRQRGVQISTPDGLIRLAPHWPNSLEEVPLVVEAFQEVQRSFL